MPYELIATKKIKTDEAICMSVLIFLFYLLFVCCFSPCGHSFFKYFLLFVILGEIVGVMRKIDEQSAYPRRKKTKNKKTKKN
jgi:hypothetical protein